MIHTYILDKFIVPHLHFRMYTKFSIDSRVLNTIISDRSRRWARLCKIIVENCQISERKMAHIRNMKLRLSSNKPSSIQNMRKDERLHHMSSGYHEKPEEKWLMRIKETVKITLNFDETGRDFIILHYARFKCIWKRRPRRAYISNFIKIGQCAHLLPCVHLLSLFQ